MTMIVDDLTMLSDASLCVSLLEGNYYLAYLYAGSILEPFVTANLRVRQLRSNTL
jgi:hypothetical protein